MSGSTPDERYRGKVAAATPDRKPATIIVTRQGVGQAARVWITTGATMLSTVVLTDEQAGRLADLVAAARDAR